MVSVWLKSEVLSFCKCRHTQRWAFSGAELLTFLLSPAGNVCTPLAPQAGAEFGSGSEMVQAVGLQRRDGPVLKRTHLHAL